MNLGQAWKVLGIARTADLGAIRKAYADRLRALDVDRQASDYADLRDARDMALRWARQQPTGTAPDPLPSESAVEPQAQTAPRAPWPHGAPQLDLLASNADPALSITAPAELGPSEIYRWPDLSAMSGRLLDIPLPVDNPFFTPGEGAGAPAPAEAQPIVIERGRDRALWQLLLGNGDGDETPLTAPEAEAAQDHLRSLLAEAEQGSLATQDAIEDWLAPTLARAWPRSAPLLERANAFFGWEKEAGKLGERQAVTFLNARLKGLRFYAKVQKPDHPLHKAWAELASTEPVGRFKNFRAARSDVHYLITGVRKNFPELEHYWNPERLGAWERTLEPGSPGGQSSNPSNWIWVIIAILGIMRGVFDIGGLSDSADPDRILDQPPVEMAKPVDPQANVLAIQRTFGPGRTLDWVRYNQSELAATIEANLREDNRAGRTPEESAERIADLVRGRIYRIGRLRTGSDLDTTMRLRLGYLEAARDVNASACMDYVRTDRLDQRAAIGSDLMAQEQRFATALVEAGQLTQPQPSKASTASVPGELVEKVMKGTRLSNERVSAAMMNKGSDADQCAVTIALLRFTLGWKGPERTAILRTL